ncbi:hypothetical protein Hamer_G005720 [Homarus americanus]|uniref:Uncharacterized protein n=1 Tax=Homarus americanus TaxID=6706 RepID=A0A8J5MN76_HOMAM|nr:hypothetical protein Hamer_G005720 [Homarus americanus]
MAVAEFAVKLGATLAATMLPTTHLLHPLRRVPPRLSGLKWHRRDLPWLPASLRMSPPAILGSGKGVVTGVAVGDGGEAEAAEDDADGGMVMTRNFGAEEMKNLVWLKCYTQVWSPSSSSNTALPMKRRNSVWVVGADRSEHTGNSHGVSPGVVAPGPPHSPHLARITHLTRPTSLI